MESGCGQNSKGFPIPAGADSTLACWKEPKNRAADTTPNGSAPPGRGVRGRYEAGGRTTGGKDSWDSGDSPQIPRRRASG